VSRRLCKLCRKNPAAVPDRESGSSRIAVCRQCHGQRLLGDMRQIMKKYDAETRRIAPERAEPGA
jgi:hypothetical protein